LLDSLLNAAIAKDLQGALMESGRPRMDGRPGMALDGQRLDALRGQQERRRQADQAAADDQDRNLVDARRVLLLPPG